MYLSTYLFLICTIIICICLIYYFQIINNEKDTPIRGFINAILEIIKFSLIFFIGMLVSNLI